MSTTRPPRPCVACGVLTRSTRCAPCEQQHQHTRNRLPRRADYRTTAWRQASRQARAQQPWCTVCGTPDDLTLDHETGQVQCRAHNSAHRRNAG